MRKPLALVAAAGLALTACSGSRSTPSSGGDVAARIERIRQQSTDGSIVFASFLRPVGDCAALLDHFHAEAAARVGPYGLPGLGGRYDAAAGVSSSGARASATAESAPSAAPATKSDNASGSGSDAFSGTNNQETGVDEPDLVKTDGRRIITITNGSLAVVPVDGTTAGTVRKVAIGDDTFQPAELLVVGDKALVFGTAWVPDETAPRVGGGVAIDIWPAGTAQATVTEVDLSGNGAPTLGRTLRVEGGYVTGRLIGSTVRMVVRSEPRNLEFVTPQTKAGEARARKSNEEVVLDSTIEDWLPSYSLVDATGADVSHGLLTDCAKVDAPTEFSGFGSLSVLTFDATKALSDGDAVSVLAGGDTVYASDTNLYVATQTWIDPEQQGNSSWSPRWNENFSTSIHQFSIDGAAPAAYLASGTVPGHVLNQFSMSEHEGVLRVATTKGTPWGATETSQSLMTTLRRNGDQLAQVGQLGDLGRGERIYSVRYAGDVAYLVTFRQTDPFYTIDLHDPAAPAVLGELKITGYSGYLHPIDDDLVIGVGQEASAQGRVQGTKVSLFDVSDLANPAELAKWTVPNAQSGAEWDHHAFLWWPATKTLVLPLNQWGGNAANQFAGAVVLRVDRATGITEQGRVSHGVERPANLGATACRVVSEEVLRQNGAPKVAGGDMLVLVCDPGQPGGAVGYQCNRMSANDLENAVPGSSVKVPEGGHVEWCWPTWNQPNPVQRSLVIGSTLWTLSQQRLQANALTTLAQTARIDW